MTRRCVTRNDAVRVAKARARATGDKISIWQCSKRCWKTGEPTAASKAKCRWRGWALPSINR